MANVDVVLSPSRPRISRGLPDIARMCFVEARPCVLLIFLLRFVVGAALGAPAAGQGHLMRACATALVWELAVFSVYLFNGVMDVHEDRVNGSRRPIASGALPESLALRVTVTAAAGALAGGLALGGDIFWAVVALLMVGFLYSGPPAYLKRQPLASAVTGMSLGLLTYHAGHSGYTDVGWAQSGAALPVFMVGVTLWIALVGAPTKDLSDVSGDVAAGRQTIPAVAGEAMTRRAVSATALALATAFCVIGTSLEGMLIWPGLAMIVGAGAMTVVCMGGFAQGSRLHRRRPYRVFMVTQYLTHLGVVAPLTAQLLLSG